MSYLSRKRKNALFVQKNNEQQNNECCDGIFKIFKQFLKMFCCK